MNREAKAIADWDVDYQFRNLPKKLSFQITKDIENPDITIEWLEKYRKEQKDFVDVGLFDSGIRDYIDILIYWKKDALDEKEVSDV